MNPEFLNSFRLETTEVKFEDINEAADACEEETAACRGVTHRHLFTLLRSGFMASERNCLGLFEDPENGSGAIYWAEDAGGSGDLKCVEQVTPETIQAFLSSLLAELEWGPLQFFGCEILNWAPDIVPKAYFTRLLQEAYDRYPGEDRWDENDEWNDPADWVDEYYIERG